MAIDPTLKHPVQMFDHDPDEEPKEGPMSPADYYQKHFADKRTEEPQEDPPTKGGSKP